MGEVKKEAALVIKDARTRITELNASIQKWEQFETLLAKFREWHDHVDVILSCRASDDVSALDVPDEYKNLQREFDQYESQIKSWKELPKAKTDLMSSSNRFQLQLGHIEQQFEALTERFNEYKQPNGLETKVERVERDISGIESNVRELSVVSADSCSAALDHAKQIALQVQKIRTDIQELKDSKNALLKDRLLTEACAEKMDSKITGFCERTDSLENKNAKTIDRLKSCIPLIGRLDDNLKEIDKVIDNVESKLDLFTQSDGVDNAEVDQSALEALQNDLNRNETSLSTAEEIAKNLKRESVKFNDDLIEQRWRRIRRTHADLRSWIDAVKGMAEDSASNLAQFDTVYARFIKILDTAEELDDMHDLISELDKNRAEKGLLLEKYRRLIKTNPDVESKFSLSLCQVEERWNRLEEKAQKSRFSVPPPQFPSALPDLKIVGSFQQKVATFHEVFTVAKNYIDFNKYPVTSVPEWADRIQTVNNWLLNYGDEMKAMLEEGRRIASRGRMELEVHDALESLDNVVDLANEVELSIKSNSALLLPLQAKAEALSREIRVMKEVLDKLAARDLSEPAIANATQRDLLDRQSQLEQLHRKSEDLHGCLPGASSGFANKEVDEIYAQVRLIEEEIGAAMKRKAVERELHSGYASSAPSFEDRSVGPDTVSVSSAGGPSLALDVQETDDEKTKYEAFQLNSSPPPKIQIDIADTLATAYIEMDKIEESISVDDPFPFERLSEKGDKLRILSNALDKIERTVCDSEMTMDIMESEAAKERIALLRSSLSAKQNEIGKMVEARNELDLNLKTSEDLLSKISVVLSGFEGRNKSPDLDELESLTVLLSDRLQQAYAQIQHTSLKAEPIIAQLGDSEASTIEDNLRKLGENWKSCEIKVNEKRRSLDERLADRSDLINEIELLEFWYHLLIFTCDETETECSSTENVMTTGAATEMDARIAERLSEYKEKLESLHKIETLKERFISSNLADPSVKQRMQCAVSDLEKRVINLKEVMDKKKATVMSIINDAKTFQDDIATALKFCNRAERAVQIVEETNLVVPSGADLDYVRSRQEQIEDLVKSIERRWKIVVSKDSPVDENQNAAVADLLAKWEQTKERIASVAHVPTLAQDSSFSESPAREEAASESKLSVRSNTEEVNEPGLIEYTSLKDTVSERESPVHKTASEKDQRLLSTVVQLRHWLSEAERDASISVDIINLQAIRDAAHAIQSFIDQLKIRHLELLRILNESGDQVVREKAELTLGDWDRILAECKRRKAVLNEMLNESRAWEKLKCIVQLWLTESQQKLDAGGKASELNEEGLRSELEELKEMDQSFNEMKEKIAEMNSRSNTLLDTYRFDEGHNLSHATSRINNLWSKFNDNLRIRRAVLEAALRSRSDFQSALVQLEEWMTKMHSSLVKLDECTCNLQLLKDSLKRKDWIDAERCFQLEMDAHEDLVNSVGEMGSQLVRSAENNSEREGLIERLETVKENWKKMRNLDDSIRQRLIDAQKEWERLISQLSENLFWVESRTKTLRDEQPVGRTLARVQKQNELVKNLEQELEKRQHEIDDCVTLAHSYLMQHDLRPKIHSVNAFAENTQTLGTYSTYYHFLVTFQGEEEAELRRVGLQINADCEDLVEKWTELKKFTQDWSRVLDDAHGKMEQMSNAVAECQLALSNLEGTMEKLTPVEQLRLEQLVGAMKESEVLKETLARARIHVDDANDWCGQLLASNIDLDLEPTALLKSVNDRYAKLKVDIRIRIAALEHALADFGPCSQHFLMSSVRPPWQRSISAVSHLPYYINHETEMTQWDHPAMVEILSQLSKFNQVKFSAYRTAMKMRAIQKRLCLDLLGLQELDTQLKFLNATNNDQLLPIKDAIMCLVPLFESAHNKFPHLVRSVPLAVDLFLNFVLDVFDPGRDGILRTFSFKVVLVLLCSANLEDKYKYLYQLVSSGDGLEQKSLALLLYDAIHIPKFFGEAAAFGGSNVEPSVRSCFETVKFARTIGIDDFLLWLKKEPQTIVWLPVMHRLASAEFAKHQAKCNVCKMYPITGLRYRCLRCFNFDICQNCFFSQRLAKNHKLSHPMQEYCVPTTSGEDVRDFGLIVRNKFRSSSKTRVGYLPVQTVDEGIPLETKNIIPTNPLTEHLHSRMQICAQRLWRANGDTSPALPENVEDSNIIDIKSPLQLLSQVEQMHKEELHQVLHKLQNENRELKKEIERRKNFDGVGSTPNLTHSFPRNTNASIASGRSVPSLPHSTDEHLMREARLLRQHKERLEERSRILEQQNKQLEVQLERLRTVLSKQQNVVFDDIKMNGQSRDMSAFSADEDEGIEYDTRPNRMPSLIASVDQLGRAMQSLVTSMVNEDEKDEVTKENGEVRDAD
ncbi:unnamed protein product [Enterobius vermicularis]|uniref:WW domain-containing protein n=1 Tax=Enterobius vermicularis TaxID=51028 RepID=A0A3P6HUC0_ENTVE|nr:unnamed protein product [Enterobius vermicularis]